MIAISCLITSFMYFFFFFFVFPFLGRGGGLWLLRFLIFAYFLLLFFSVRLFETAHAAHIFKRFELLSGNRFLVLKHEYYSSYTNTVTGMRFGHTKNVLVGVFTIAIYATPTTAFFI